MSLSTLGVKVEPQIRERLKVLSELKDRSSHWLMKKAILEYLDREEALEKEKQEDMARWEAYENSGKAFSHEEVRTWLDSVGGDQEKACPQ